MKLLANKAQKIVTAKQRCYCLIGNLTDSTVYISKVEYSSYEDYVSNAFAIKLNGVVELNPCMYQGDFYAYSTVESDIRIMEL